MRNWLLLLLFIWLIIYIGQNFDDYSSRANEKTDIANKEKPAKKENRTCRDKPYAYNITKQLIKMQLKSPTSAKFASIFNKQQVSIVSEGTCHFRILSHVDSQNSFGAMTRMKFSALVHYNVTTTKWSLLEFRESTQ